MTDKEKVSALLIELGVGFEVRAETLTCESGMEKVDGYTGFMTIFEFDSRGKFQQLGAWE